MKTITNICFIISLIFSIQILILSFESLFFNQSNTQSMGDSIFIALFFLFLGLVYSKYNNLGFYVKKKCDCVDCKCKNCNCKIIN